MAFQFTLDYTFGSHWSFSKAVDHMFLDYFALFMLFFVGVVLFYTIIVVHDIPYEIAVKRNHPHQDAIHIAGWVSLFTLHILWPFLWIWATLWREDRGWGFAQIKDEQLVLHHKLLELEDEIRSLRSLVAGDAETPVSDPGNAKDEDTGKTADSAQEGKS